MCSHQTNRSSHPRSRKAGSGAPARYKLTLSVILLGIPAWFSPAPAQEQGTSSTPSQDARERPGFLPDFTAEVDFSGGSDRPAEDGTHLFEREVFAYRTAGRRDPFRAPSDAWVGDTPAGLTLVGFVVHHDGSRSVVALIESGTGRRHYAREGDMIAGSRIVAIHAQGIETVLDDSEGRQPGDSDEWSPSKEAGR